MSLVEQKFTLAAGQLFSEIIEITTTENDETIFMPANDIAEVKATVRRQANRQAPALYTKTLTRSGNGYPFTLTSEETTALNSGTYFADVYVRLSSGAVAGYPVRLVLTVEPTTTQP